jgi:hypothetical protein
MPRSPLTKEAHLRLISLYEDFGRAVRLRKKFLINQAYQTLEALGELLTRADSWEYWRERKRRREKTNGQANHR